MTIVNLCINRSLIHLAGDIVQVVRLTMHDDNAHVRLRSGIRFVERALGATKLREDRVARPG